MAVEIELKLRVAPGQARRLSGHPALTDATPQKYSLFNTYYDTPDFALRKRRIALRLRRKGRATWLMTVKAEDAGAGGLARRLEWEVPTQPGVFDFSIVTDEALRDFLTEQLPLLRPAFSTDFTRTAWTLRRGDALIELALDRGKITAPGANEEAPAESEAISEVELELLEGPSPDALFDLAIELACDLHLHPLAISKAERGYNLADPSLVRPVKRFSSPVARGMAPIDAFRAIALCCLGQLQRNEAGAVCGDHPEYVHQARVAIRRLRSAFRLFAPVLGPDFIAVYSPRWREVATALGGARDWDVFLSETLPPLEEVFSGHAGLAQLRRHAEVAQGLAQATARATLTGENYSRLLLAFGAALFRVEPPTIEAGGDAARRSLGKFARRRLQKRAATVQALMKGNVKMDAEHRHLLRIAFKKLRYAIEFFAPLLPRKSLVAYQASLATIQELLGVLNDQATALRLIGEAQHDGLGDSLAYGWIAGRSQLLIAELEAELRKVEARKKPWQGNFGKCK